jgi:hypothetical protein
MTISFPEELCCLCKIYMHRKQALPSGLTCGLYFAQIWVVVAPPDCAALQLKPPRGCRPHFYRANHLLNESRDDTFILKSANLLPIESKI